MRIKIFSDGADIQEMIKDSQNPIISGFTTNPTLMAKAGVQNYLSFATEAIAQISKPISFEVFSDEISEMEIQAHKIAKLGNNVFVKIPIQNTRGDSTAALINSLSSEGVKLNITAIFTDEQVRSVHEALSANTPAVISIFAGRIANAGIDPEPMIKKSVSMFVETHPKAEILWASSREVFNVVQAERCGCHIITLSPNLINAMKDLGKDLDQFSRETVQMFYDDAVASGFRL